MVLQNKSDNSTVHHALQNCQIRMVLQNKSDSSNGPALKSSNFRLNLSFWRCLSQKRTHFRENFLGNDNFRENENFRENLLIFAFSLFANKEKTVFVSTLVWSLSWKIDETFYRTGSGDGFGQSQKWILDINRLDPQHCFFVIQKPILSPP
jgi:hypothetical protein